MTPRERGKCGGELTDGFVGKLFHDSITAEEKAVALHQVVDPNVRDRDDFLFLHREVRVVLVAEVAHGTAHRKLSVDSVHLHMTSGSRDPLVLLRSLGFVVFGESFETSVWTDDQRTAVPDVPHQEGEEFATFVVLLPSPLQQSKTGCGSGLPDTLLKRESKGRKKKKKKDPSERTLQEKEHLGRDSPNHRSQHPSPSRPPSLPPRP